MKSEFSPNLWLQEELTVRAAPGWAYSLFLVLTHGSHTNPSIFIVSSVL